MRCTGRRVGILLALVMALGAAFPAAALGERLVDERPFHALDGPLAATARVAIEPLVLEDGTQLVLEVSPVEPFAKDAEIVVHGPDGDSHIAPPSDHWFAGRVAGDPESFVMLARGTTLRGLVVTAGRVAAISPRDDAYAGGTTGPSYVRSFSPEADVPEAVRNFTCASDALPGVHGAGAIGRVPAASGRRALTSVMYYAGVAIETDYEMYQTKGSASALAQYVGDLFAASTAIYQRDLLMTLQVNYLSIWTTPSDPWVATTSINGLYEFGDYWHANRAGVPRKTAHFLSGRNLGGGVAWVGVMCGGDFSAGNGHYGGGYGISGNMSGQFSTTNPGLYWDLFVVTHEIGHNFGTPHTHCYSPPVDMCYSGESGCYSGPTSVPAVKGTIMSYCHLQPGGFSNDKLFFGVSGEPSQAVTTLMRSYIEGDAACFGTVAGPVISSISPSTGVTAGGTPVTITGTGFTSPATVKIGGSSATSVVVVSATTVTAHTPAGAAGAADVAVVVTANSQGMTLVGGFTYTAGLPPPGVTGIGPKSGPIAGGTAVTIAGTSFVSGATVSIGGVAATSVVFVNSGSLTAVTGAHATAAVDVVVTNPDTQTGTLTKGFFYSPPAAATKLSTLTPCRVLDTRNATGALGGPALQPNATRVFVVKGTCGIPAGAVSISANLTVVPTASGVVTVYPGNGVNAGTNSVAFGAGQTRANNAILYLSTDGTGSISVTNASSGANNFLVDVNGYFQ